MTTNQLVAARIREIRESKKLLLEDVAVKLNTSVASYSRIENGKTQINVETLNKLSKILESNMLDLFNIKPENNFNEITDNYFSQIGNNHSLVLNIDKEEFFKIKELLSSKIKSNT